MQASAAQTPQTTEFPALLRAEHQAVASGDGAAIIRSARSVIASALLQLGDQRMTSGDAAGAVGVYKTSLATEPSHRTQLDLAEAMIVAGQDVDGARSLAQSVLDEEPGNARARQLAAGDAARPQTPARAGASQKTLATEGELRRALAAAYDDWGTAVLRAQGDYQGGSLLFGAAAHWDPTTPGVMKNLGLAQFHLGHFDQSADAFRAAIEAQPGDEETHVLLGLSLFSSKQFGPAAEAFAPAKSAAMRHVDSAYAWAFSLAHSNEPLQANGILDQIVDRPMPVEQKRLVCQVYEQTENYQHAVQCLQAVASEAPASQHVHLDIGISLIHMSRPADAVPELRKELAASPDDVDAQFYLAYALAETSQKPEAQKLLTAVVAQQPQNGEAQYQLGKLYAEQQQWPAAIEHLRAAATVMPQSYDIHYQLQNAYRRNGQPEDAARELAIYRSIKNAGRPQ